MTACSSGSNPTAVSNTGQPQTSIKPTLGLIPVFPVNSPPPTGQLLVNVASGEGPRSIGAIYPRGNQLFVTYECRGAGSFAVRPLFDVRPCNGQVSTARFIGQGDKTLQLRVLTSKDTTWALLIQDAE